MNCSTGSTQEEIKRFPITPEKGNKVKVYLNEKKDDKKYVFGTVLYVEVAKVDDEEEKHKKKVLREILVLQEVKTEYKVDECDFCLTLSKVRFQNWSYINQPKHTK